MCKAYAVYHKSLPKCICTQSHGRMLPNNPSAYCQQNIGNIERALGDRKEEKCYKLLLL